MSASSKAQFTYDFIGESVRQGTGTVTAGDVLATIEFSGFPARHDDVLGLTFTTAGDELFGLGLTFDDEFGFTTGALVPDEASGLVSTNPAGGGYTAVIENDESSIHDARALLLGTSTAGGPVNTIGLAVPGLPFIVFGRFELVPNLVGDCNDDNVLNAADLSCVSSVEDRDVVLDALHTHPGDLDGNGEVAFADFLVLSANFGTDSPSYADGNIDLTSGVDFEDFLVFSANFGKTPSDVTAVPEPTSLVAAWISLLGLVASRRTRTR